MKNYGFTQEVQFYKFSLALRLTGVASVQYDMQIQMEWPLSDVIITNF